MAVPVLHLTTNAAPARRTVGPDGRTYLVAPLTMIKKGVLPGSKGPLMYEDEDTSAVTENWHDIPITLGHPYDVLTGNHQDANDDGVWERSGLGYVKNPSHKNSRLKGEGWFDEEYTRNKAPVTYGKLLRGEPISLSTGLYTYNEECRTNCSFNGRDFTHYARAHQPNHLAILENEKGACSIEDGCGVNVTNSKLPPQVPAVPRPQAPRPKPAPCPGGT